LQIIQLDSGDTLKGESMGINYIAKFRDHLEAKSMWIAHVVALSCLLGGLVHAQVSSTGSFSAGQNTSSGMSKMSEQECQAKARQVAAIEISPNASVTMSTETVMWMARTTIEMIDRGCPGGTPEQLAAERLQYQQELTEAENACNAEQSGGRRCVSQVHPAAVAASRPTVPAQTSATRGANPASTDTCRKRPDFPYRPGIPKAERYEQDMYSSRTYMELVDHGCFNNKYSPDQLATKRQEYQKNYRYAEYKCKEARIDGSSCVAQDHANTDIEALRRRDEAATATRQMAREPGANSGTSSNATSAAGARATVTVEARGHSATFGPPSTAKRNTGGRP
jgi:hypothetical protein